MVRAVFETNVLGVIAVTNAMLPLLRRSPAPRIVNVSSHAASLTLAADPDGPFAALLPSAAYSPSKSALNALTVQYANELRKDGILVNAVAPASSTPTATTTPVSSPSRRAPRPSCASPHSARTDRPAASSPRKARWPGDGTPGRPSARRPGPDQAKGRGSLNAADGHEQAEEPHRDPSVGQRRRGVRDHRLPTGPCSNRSRSTWSGTAPGAADRPRSDAANHARTCAGPRRSPPATWCRTRRSSPPAAAWPAPDATRRSRSGPSPNR